MTKKELMVYVTHVLTALAEGGGWSPEGALYTGLGMDLDRWQAVRHVLVGAGLVTIKSYQVELTDLGRETAQKLEAVLQKARS